MRRRRELHRRTGNQAPKLTGGPRLPEQKVATIRTDNRLPPGLRTAAAWSTVDNPKVNAKGKFDMTRIGTRAEVWFCNVVASFARYVAERTLPESVPMLMRRDAIIDSFNYAKENMQDAYSFLDRFEGLSLSIEDARRRFRSRTRVLEFGVYKAGMINYQARKFPALNFVGFDSFEGLQQNWSGMAPEKTFDLGGSLPKVRPNVALVKGWFAEQGPRWKAANPASAA